MSVTDGAPLPQVEPKAQQQQKMRGPLRSSRSPFRNLLRSSTKRSRGSPSPVTASPPPPQALSRSPTAGLSSQMLNISLPSDGDTPVSPMRIAPKYKRHSAQSATSTDIPKMPAFLNLSPQEIEHKYQDLVWMERDRLQNSTTAPTGRWTRVSGPHLRLLDRYMNVQPWEKNRVKLKVPPGQIDYINASPIVLTTTAPSHAQRPPDRYIAMQGPKISSVDHVWRMVYEQMRSPAVIVMLTETHDGIQEKCYPYFPRSPDDSPIMINDHDEFGDGFHASVHCAEIEETPFGDAIELRRLVLRVHKKASPASALSAKRASSTSSHSAGNSTKDKDNTNGLNGGAKKATDPSPADKAIGLRVPAKDEDGDSVMSEVSAGSASSPATAIDSASVPSITETDEAGTSRVIDISEYEDERIVYHFLFKRWPDFGVPAIDDVESFLGLMRLSAEKNADAQNPRIVHCSAGVGRSGTFIALEHLLRELDMGVLENYDVNFPPSEVEDVDMDGADGHSGRGRIANSALHQNDSASPASSGTGTVDRTSIGSNLLGSKSQSPCDANDLIYTTVNQLREQRRMMVQGESQYRFIYHVLRKLWLEKYRVVDSDNSQSHGQSQNQSQGSNGMDDDEASECSNELEPAAKRLEVDPAAVMK
ncbi:protein-tyrosine phosphatase 2 [Sporothrix brasiliensis 5110]|uniref:Protein-tyrosine phosphatase 2 n=1 Tax=Sporothrix brasiliensis 5110 TaxID=1398154 RepID=A0A0C2IVK9_9PEZI|nr:protein-tyrosine phosphatase 2 [Sporothrix brasiliensis 5110]KIH89027.1 protein-tyrosine phosphatase 2 [Sporothrix brasiliensis 5110]